MGKPFGQILREHREHADLGLREFAGLIGVKPSTLSAIERGSRKPWSSNSKLIECAEQLGLSRGTTDWIDFFEAAASPGTVPADIQESGMGALLPSMLRTIDNAQLSEKELKQLIDQIKTERSLKTSDFG